MNFCSKQLKESSNVHNKKEENIPPVSRNTRRAPMDSIPKSEHFYLGEGSSTPHSKQQVDNEEKHKTTSTESNSSSTVSTPSSSDFSVVDSASIVNRSRDYLNNLVCSLEDEKIDVEMFVLLLQNIFRGDEVLICQPLEERSSIFAIGDMIEQTVRKLVKKRDDICVDDDESKKQWTKLDRLIAELIIRQETLC